jgi:Zn-dependent peptidase ImmA (M78 family)
MSQNKEIYRQMEQKAFEFRQKSNFNATEPLPLESLLLQLNVITSFQEMSDNLSGMAVKVKDNNEYNRFILVNATQSLGRQNFTICHELYHLFIQENFTAQFCITGNFDYRKGIEEYKADIFASFLLLPSFGIESNIPNEEQQLDKISLDTILKIEHYYGCSRTALLYRLKNLGFITNEVLEQFKVEVKKRAYQQGYNTRLYENARKGVLIGNYGSLASSLYDKEKISEGHFMELMTTIGVNIFNSKQDDNG